MTPDAAAPRWVVVTRPDRPGLLDELAWRYRLAPWVDVLAERRRGDRRQRQELPRGRPPAGRAARGARRPDAPARLPARGSRRRLRRVRGDRPRGRAVPRVRRDRHVRDAALRSSRRRASTCGSRTTPCRWTSTARATWWSSSCTRSAAVRSWRPGASRGLAWRPSRPRSGHGAPVGADEPPDRRREVALAKQPHGNDHGHDAPGGGIRRRARRPASAPRSRGGAVVTNRARAGRRPHGRSVNGNSLSTTTWPSTDRTRKRTR